VKIEVGVTYPGKAALTLRPGPDGEVDEQTIQPAPFQRNAPGDLLFGQQQGQPWGVDCTNTVTFSFTWKPPGGQAELLPEVGVEIREGGSLSRPTLEGPPTKCRWEWEHATVTLAAPVEFVVGRTAYSVQTTYRLAEWGEGE
jgi:hypothetical protein